MILDSSFLIDLMDSRTDAVAQARQLESASVPRTVPTMVLTELYVGVGYAERTGREARRVETVVESCPIADVTERIARRAGRIIGQLKRDGEPVSKGDALIAATGLVRDEPVLTRNVADFSRVPGLAVRSY